MDSGLSLQGAPRNDGVGLPLENQARRRPRGEQFPAPSVIRPSAVPTRRPRCSTDALGADRAGFRRDRAHQRDLELERGRRHALFQRRLDRQPHAAVEQRGGKAAMHRAGRIEQAVVGLGGDDDAAGLPLRRWYSPAFARWCCGAGCPRPFPARIPGRSSACAARHLRCRRFWSTCPDVSWLTCCDARHRCRRVHAHAVANQEPVHPKTRKPGARSALSPPCSRPARPFASCRRRSEKTAPRRRASAVRWRGAFRVR